MKLRNFLLASVSLWALLAEQAQAAPVVAAIGAIASTGFGAALTKFVIGFGIQAGLSLYQKAKAKKAQRNQQPRGINVSVRTGDDNPIEFPVGKSATAGIRAYAGTWGQAGKTPNAYFTDVLEISNLPVPGLAGMWAGDKKCTVLWNEPHADGRGCPVQEYRSGNSDHMWVKFVDGSQTVADPFLRTNFGAHATRPYKATMIGRGVAYVIVTTRFNQDLFPAGKPEYLFEPSPPVFYDLRKDSTAGGNGPHRWGDRSTHEPNENNAVIIYNIIRGLYYGTEWVYGGRNLSAFRLPASNWMAAANECDRLIALAAGGTEKQFRCGMQVRGDTEPLEVIEELRKGCNGQLSECGGVFKLLVGAPGAAVYSFTDANVVTTSPQELDPFPAPDEIFNGIEATFPEPAERWVSKDAPARYDAALEAADDGHRRTSSIQFLATPHAITVQRLMEAMLKDGRRFTIHTINLPPEAKPLEPNDVIAWTSARNGYTNKKFLIVRTSGAPGFRQTVTIKEIDPADHGWSIGMEAPTSIGHVGPTPVPPQPMTGWTAVPDQVADADGKAMRPAIRVGCGADMDDVDRIHVLVRFKDSQAIVFDSDQTPYPRPGSGHPYQWLLSGAWCLPAKGYQVAGKFVPKSNRPTTVSAWIDVVTPNVLMTDVTVGLGQTRDDVLNRFKELQKELSDSIERMDERLLEFSLANAIGQRQRLTLRAELGNALARIDEERRVRVSAEEALAQSIVVMQASLGNANARLAQEETVRATETSALAQSALTISAELKDRFAGGMVKFSAAADQSGVNVRYAMVARANIGDAYKEVGQYLEIYTVNGVLKSRSATIADQWVVSDGTNRTFPMVYEGGVLKLNIADIGTVYAGTINFGGGKVIINADGFGIWH